MTKNDNFLFEDIFEILETSGLANWITAEWRPEPWHLVKVIFTTLKLQQAD